MLHICMQRTMAEFRKIKVNGLPKEEETSNLS